MVGTVHVIRSRGITRISHFRLKEFPFIRAFNSEEAGRNKVPMRKGLGFSILEYEYIAEEI